MGENASPAMYVEINGGKRWPLEMGQLYLFGKHLPSNDGDNKIAFNIDDEEVDEKHCCVEVSVDEVAYVFDLFSTAGTFVNGERLKPLEKTCVNHGDVMKMGKLQDVKFLYHEQLEISHDSSGFGDNNKNTSDIIGSSPESTTQRGDGRLKRFNSHNNDNFLVPAVPPPPKTSVSRASLGCVIPETEELSTSRRSSFGFNVSQNISRRSDSFSIPETQQYCAGRASTASNLSIAESIPDDDRTKSDINFDVTAGDDNDFCIPETQEVMTMNNEKQPRSLNKVITNVLKTLEEKSVDLNDSDEDNDSLGGSQFRICTQDYNEGFGEENNESMMHSQVIPLIKHTTVLLNGSCVKQSPVKTPKPEMPSRKSNALDEDKELANMNWSTDKAADEEVKNLTNCSTPDLFEFEAVENARTKAANDGGNGANLFEDNADPPATALEDEEDFLPTQVFPPSNNSKSSNDKGKTPKEKDIFSSKEDEPFLTLSDKENMHPDRLEPITDLPPTQLFATHDAPPERSVASTSSRKSNLSKSESNQNETLTAVFLAPSTANKDSNVATNVMGDEEDDILTQAFVQPAAKPAPKTLTHNYFNSTLLDDRAMDRNPASFFAEMETTPKKVRPEATEMFRMPEKEFTSVKKTSSAASTTSTSTYDSDMDLLMCTPQLIKEHMEFPKGDELKKRILAAKNKKLFGEDTDEGEDLDDERKSKDGCLVELINVPKDSKDFDKLLPHLKHGLHNHMKKKCLLTEEQKAAKEACKQYKFNLSFGKDQETGKNTNSASSNSTLSRDERHAARDKERDAAEQKVTHKKIDRSNNDEKQKNSRRNKQEETQTSKTESKSTTRKTREKDVAKKHEEKQTNNTSTSKQETEKTSSKQERTSKRKGEPASNKQDSPKESNEEQPQRPSRKAQEKDTAKKQRAAKSNDEKIEEKPSEAEKEEVLPSVKQRPARRRTRLQSGDKPQNDTDEVAIKLPAKRSTRLKSVTEQQKVKTTTSKASVAASDELDLIPTQPMPRTTRARTRSRSGQNDPNESYETNSSASSSVVSHHTTSSSASRTLNRSSSRLNTSHTALVQESSTVKTTSVTSTIERKRKSDITVPQQNAERKRLKRTDSQDSRKSSSATSAPQPAAAPTRRLISITMVEPEKFNELNEKSKGLWAVAKDPTDSEVLVMDKSFRTFKFLLAMARGIPIVTSQWLKDINLAKSLKKVPPTTQYIFSDPVFEKKHKFSLEKSLQLARDNKNGILHGHEFVMTANIKPSPAELKAIIEIAGGTVHVKGPPPPKDNQKIYLISSLDDRKDWHKFRRLNTNIVIIATEAIMSAVMRQNCSPLLNHVLA